MGRSKYQNAPIGEEFGLWVVEDYSHYNNEHYWVVTCLGCDSIHRRRASQLVLGRSKSCRACAAKERESKKSPFWSGYKEMSGQYLSKLKHRGKEVDVTLKDLYDKWTEQKGKCVYSGVKLSLVAKDTGWVSSTASIDRVDSSKGYITSNIQWVHKRINSMKGEMTEEEFKEWCRLVSNGGSCGV